MKLGPSFPDSIKTEKFKRRRFYEPSHIGQRNLFVSLTALLIGLVLLLALLKVQIFQGAYYRHLSDGNRIKEEVVHAPRGIIYDRAGTPLVHNVPGFRIKDSSGKTKPIEKDEALSLLAKSRSESLEIDSLRQYVSPEVFAHVLGFIGEISKDELVRASQNYRGGDFIGKTGIEKMYEAKLRGTDGRELIEVDNNGKKVRTLGMIDPTSGVDLTLSIDRDLSIGAFKAMEEVRQGALIVSRPQTGEILALISKPSFDANLFTLGDHYKAQHYMSSRLEFASEYKAATESGYRSIDAILTDDVSRPLFNRAVSGVYPPGSTFKIITAAAGLETGKINEQTQIEDIGVIRIGPFSFPNWYFNQYGKTEGSLDIVRAIKRSNDIFFYKVAEQVGLEDLASMGKKFGLGEQLGIDLPEEENGLFPTDAWKRETIGEQWFLGDTYHLGIGQGYLLTTPLQMNFWTEVIANNGTLCQPTLLKADKKDCKVKNKKFLSQKTISLITQGMKEACDTGGTGWPLFKFKVKNSNLKIDEKNYFTPDDAPIDEGWVRIPVACKTGTAEYGDPKNRTHAWFTVFAPVENPEIVVTVLVEGGGEGSNVAAPIAKKVLEEWFSR